MSNPRNIEWMAQGNCRLVPAETMFPSTGTGVTIAQAICAACAVRQTCLEYALLHRIDHGVWGGTSERERKRIAAARRRATRTSSL
jgi:WhiB family transcriptional regulator, redox-sensing transcriptional regulator